MPSLIFSTPLRARPTLKPPSQFITTWPSPTWREGDRKAALASAEEAVTSGYQKARDFRDGLRRRP